MTTKKVAVIGASADLAKASGFPLRNIANSKFTGKIYPINLRAGEITLLQVGLADLKPRLCVVGLLLKGVLELDETALGIALGAQLSRSDQVIGGAVAKATATGHQRETQQGAEGKAAHRADGTGNTHGNVLSLGECGWAGRVNVSAD